MIAAAANGPLGQNMLAWKQFGGLNLPGALQAADGAAPPPAGSAGVRIGDLDASVVNNGSTWMVRVDVYVHDESHAAVNSGTVAGQWRHGLASECTINAGQCQVVSSPIAKKNGTVNLSISSTSVSGSDYLPGAHHDPDG